MNPVVDKVAKWREEDKKAALATVVEVERSRSLGLGPPDRSRGVYHRGGVLRKKGRLA